MFLSIQILIFSEICTVVGASVLFERSKDMRQNLLRFTLFGCRFFYSSEIVVVIVSLVIFSLPGH